MHGTCSGEKSEPCMGHILINVGSDGIIAFIYRLCSVNLVSALAACSKTTNSQELSITLTLASMSLQ